MKGDFTRFTFQKEKHYKSVRMQQGRVQIDADFNEQRDITNHRIQTESIDTIGPCGAPRQAPGFRIVQRLNLLTAAEAALGEIRIAVDRTLRVRPRQISPPDFLISAGRYYVDGILCENEQAVTYSGQVDFPEAPLPQKEGVYLAYLDVWSRHITALEDPQIREKALGGPDHGTREKTVWQVKLLHLTEGPDAVKCTDSPEAWETLTMPLTGKMSAQGEPGQSSNDPCLVEPGAGFRGLENQLYRVEVQERDGQDKATFILSQALFKWSRDNGSIVAEWTSQDQSNSNRLTVRLSGRDKVRDFAPRQWVELTDDRRELLGQPGTLVPVTSFDGQTLTIDAANKIGTAILLKEFPLNPKVRRWDGIIDWNQQDKQAKQVKANQEYELEDGLKVTFSGGTYKTGDYWQIPARTADGEIEWPQESEKPVQLPPHGVRHHYCRLALLTLGTNQEWTRIVDCRQLFPSASLFYLGGDGQEVSPDLSQEVQPPPDPPPRVDLHNPLRAGVFSGRWPVVGTKVRFEIRQGDGAVKASPNWTETAKNKKYVDILTNQEGIASCQWALEIKSSLPQQQVEAKLLHADGTSTEHLPICFNARLSIAQQVAYNPGCEDLKKAKAGNVQEALDELCALIRERQCYTHLDELRADGVVRDERGILGCRVTQGDTRLSLNYEAGIAYVAGCRHEIKAGAIEADASSTGQILLVDAEGKVILATKRQPPKYAALAVIATFEGEIKSIVDVRFDLTQLDEKVEDNRERLTARRHDRRSFVPLLAHGFPHLRLRDGRNHEYRLKQAGRLVFVGQPYQWPHTPTPGRLSPYSQLLYPKSPFRDLSSVWVTNENDDKVFRIPRDARLARDQANWGETSTNGFQTYSGVYDGSNVWFTSAVTDEVLRVPAYPPFENQFRLPVGTKPRAIAFDGHFIWVANVGDNTISIIEVDTLRSTIDTGPIQLPHQPQVLAFDGEFMWIGCSEARIFKVPKEKVNIGNPLPAPQEVDHGNLAVAIVSMVFDGSFLWVAAVEGPVTKYDVLTNESTDTRSETDSRLVFDGSHIYSFEGNDLRKLDADSGVVIGPMHLSRKNWPNRELIDAVFDGTHLWLSYRDKQNRESGGIQKILVG